MILFLKLFEMIFWKLQSSVVYSLVSEFFQLHHTMLESVQINICRLCRLCPVWDTRLFIFSLLSDPILSSESSFFFHNHLFAFHTCTNQAEACTRVFFRPCSCLWMKRCYRFQHCPAEFVLVCFGNNVPLFFFFTYLQRQGILYIEGPG